MAKRKEQESIMSNDVVNEKISNIENLVKETNDTVKGMSSALNKLEVKHATIEASHSEHEKRINRIEEDTKVNSLKIVSNEAKSKTVNSFVSRVITVLIPIIAGICGIIGWLVTLNVGEG